MSNMQFIDAIAREAGAFIRRSVDTQATQKSNMKDFVTVADIKSQDIISQKLAEHFPGSLVISEEQDEAARVQMLGRDFSGFVIDPIDGTYNFKRDMRESAISIGYIKNGEPEYGVIYDPYKDELYSAEKGRGAFRNGRPIHVSKQATLAGASIATSNSYDDEAMARNLRRHLAIYEQTGIMPWTNCPGSGVLIMAYVACGRFDIYHHNGLKPWDNAAGFLLVREAGGVVESLSSGLPAPFTENAVLMGAPGVVAKLRTIFMQISGDLLE